MQLKHYSNALKLLKVYNTTKDHNSLWAYCGFIRKFAAAAKNLETNYTFFVKPRMLESLIFLVNPHMHKMGPGGLKYYIFGDQCYSENASKLRFHVFFHFKARRHTIS